jgi:hypothetical protein
VIFGQKIRVGKSCIQFFWPRLRIRTRTKIVRIHKMACSRQSFYGWPMGYFCDKSRQIDLGRQIDNLAGQFVFRYRKMALPVISKHPFWHRYNHYVRTIFIYKVNGYIILTQESLAEVLLNHFKV